MIGNISNMITSPLIAGIRSTARTQPRQQYDQQVVPTDFTKQLLSMAGGIYNDQKARSARMDAARVNAQRTSSQNAGKMGGYIDRAMNTLEGNWGQAQNYLLGMQGQIGNDPGMMQARSFARQDAVGTAVPYSPVMQRLEAMAMQPVQGLDPSVLATIKGNLASRSAASMAGGSRRINAMAASGGVRGAGLSSLLTMDRLSRGVGLNNAMSDAEMNFAMEDQKAKQQGFENLSQVAGMRTNLDLNNARFRESARERLMSIAGNQMNTKANLGKAYVDSLTAYNPMQWLGQAQQLTAPLQQLPNAMMQSAVGPANNMDLVGMLSSLVRRRPKSAQQTYY